MNIKDLLEELEISKSEIVKQLYDYTLKCTKTQSNLQLEEDYYENDEFLIKCKVDKDLSMGLHCDPTGEDINDGILITFSTTLFNGNNELNTRHINTICTIDLDQSDIERQIIEAKCYISNLILITNKKSVFYINYVFKTLLCNMHTIRNVLNITPEIRNEDIGFDMLTHLKSAPFTAAVAIQPILYIELPKLKWKRPSKMFNMTIVMKTLFAKLGLSGPLKVWVSDEDFEDQENAGTAVISFYVTSTMSETPLI